MCFYQNDHLGTPQHLFQISGALVWQGEYDAFGEIRESNTRVENPLRMAGQYHDRETNLYYNHHRYYDPTKGRYIKADPIGLRGGSNTYSYANQNPLHYIDPTGELAWIPVALGAAYARCVGGCLVGAGLGYLAEQLLSGCEGLAAPGWGTAAGALAGCAKTCLNPLEWIGGGKRPKGGKGNNGSYDAEGDFGPLNQPPKKPALPDSAWHKNAPHQVMPGTKPVTHQKYNSKTNQLEKSKVEYDQYGRQEKRTDYTDHGYGNPTKPKEYHSNPHTHTYEYGPGYGPKGKETRVNQ